MEIVGTERRVLLRVLDDHGCDTCSVGGVGLRFFVFC